ncbi:MAG: hypothetical protein U9Q15_03795 [Patescibacteria group bacterium]|nr:hypothetical protein [Patescibacteria group bacterium]
MISAISPLAASQAHHENHHSDTDHHKRHHFMQLEEKIDDVEQENHNEIDDIIHSPVSGSLEHLQANIENKSQLMHAFLESKIIGTHKLVHPDANLDSHSIARSNIIEYQQSPISYNR